MMSRIVCVILITLCSASFTFSSYSGPFLFWGVEDLNNFKLPALQAIEDENLQEIYSKASATLIFLKSFNTKMSKENFPQLSKMVYNSESLYLTQDTLPVDPVNFNVNTEIHVLFGDVEQQDEEIASIFHKFQAQFGDKNVLGVLASRNVNNNDHFIEKRDVSDELNEFSKLSEEPEKRFTVKNMFIAENQALMHLHEAPILTVFKDGFNRTFVLKNHLSVSINETSEHYSLIVDFSTLKADIKVQFNFYNFSGWWTLNETEVEFEGKTTKLENVNRAFEVLAPKGFSFGCSGPIFFQNPPNITMSLNLTNIQVQPWLSNVTRFSRSYDCIGVMSPGLASGIFVTFIFATILTLGITAILNIKTPNRFENRNSKPLSFNIQE